MKIEFTRDDKILLVGEGNFSFSQCLCATLGQGFGITATSLDTDEQTIEKYPDARDRIEELQDMGARVMHGVDGTKLKFKHRFNYIIFNFPHVGLGIKDRDRNIRANQELVLGFFQSARRLLMRRHLGDDADGAIVITVKQGDPYDLWDIKKLAKNAQLKCIRSSAFRPDDWPGYEHRRTLGFDARISKTGNAEIKNSRAYVFEAM